MKHIMLIHKDADTRFTLQTLLEKNGFKVTPINSFEEYIKKVNKNVDLILLDGLMPRNKIIEIASEKGIKIVYLIGDDTQAEELKMYKNVVGAIEEPRDINLFLKKIKKLIR